MESVDDLLVMPVRENSLLKLVTPLSHQVSASARRPLPMLVFQAASQLLRRYPLFLATSRLPQAPLPLPIQADLQLSWCASLNHLIHLVVSRRVARTRVDLSISPTTGWDKRRTNSRQQSGSYSNSCG
jgi:hypothetical protein